LINFNKITTFLKFLSKNYVLAILTAIAAFHHFSDNVNYFLMWGSALGTWLIYYLDKNIDLNRGNINRTDRHFSSELDKNFQKTIGLVLLALTIYNFSFLNFKTIGFIIAILVCCAFYFLFLSKLQMFKEVFSSVVFTLSVCVFPQFLSQQLSVVDCILFELIVFSNMLLLAIKDYEYDKVHHFNSLCTRLGTHKTTILFVSALVISIAISIFIKTELQFWVLISSGFYLALLFLKLKIKNIVYHFWADMVFMMLFFF